MGRPRASRRAAQQRPPKPVPPNSVVRAFRTPVPRIDWFTDAAGGNFHLSRDGQAQFTNIATWEDGDPPFDFEGEARPATNGSTDFPGADTIP